MRHGASGGGAYDKDLLAAVLGYILGAGSLLLYTPIAIRILRQRHADGLALSTWWLKLSSYLAALLYSFRRGYPVSTYIETLIITVEAAVLLLLVAQYQRRLFEPTFTALTLLLFACLAFGLLGPPWVAALAQTLSTLLNTGALLPQIHLNWHRRSSGDYSPITASLAFVGCLIRLFTTVQLSGGDALLLLGFGSALVLNAALLAQIGYYGTVVERKTVAQVLTADFTGFPVGGGATRKREDREVDLDKRSDNSGPGVKVDSARDVEAAQDLLDSRESALYCRDARACGSSRVIRN